MIDKPEFDALRVHTLDLDTMQPARAELADETIPSAQDARLFAARFDAVNPCREDLLRAVAILRPDLAPVLADECKAAGVISELVVERQVTWAEAARRAQMLSSDVRCGKRSRRQTWNGLLTSSHSTRVFYGGAQAILDILMTGPEATESDFDRMEGLSAELRRFGEDVEAGRA